jgi:hypothetical protein
VNDEASAPLRLRPEHPRLVALLVVSVYLELATARGHLLSRALHRFNSASVRRDG